MIDGFPGGGHDQRRTVLTALVYVNSVLFFLRVLKGYSTLREGIRALRGESGSGLRVKTVPISAETAGR